MSIRWFLVIVILLSNSGLSNVSAELPPLIPRQVLFGAPERMHPQVSPNGTQIAYLAPDKNEVLQVWVRTLGKQDDRMLTRDKKRGIQGYGWLYDGEHLAYEQDSDGDENWHIYMASLTTGIVRDLTPFQGVQAQVVATLPEMPHELLIAMNLKDRRKHDVYRINIQTGALALDTENPGTVTQWVVDRQLQIRAAVAFNLSGGSDLIVRETVDKPWQTLRHWDSDEQGFAISFSQDGKKLTFFGNHEANAMRLLSIDVASGQETVLAEDSQYDVETIVLHPATWEIQAAGFLKDKLEWQILDPSVAADFEALSHIQAGQFDLRDPIVDPRMAWIGKHDLQDTNWIVSYVTDNGPISYYVYDRATKKGTRLFSHDTKLENRNLAAMQPVSYQARDGLTIHAYLTTPVGLPAKDLPTVLLVHGGPWWRDRWGYNPEAQWLANRGYAVLQVNYRGSTGYGKDFLNAGNREWAGKMHNDLIDGVNWLITNGTADPKKIAIMGSSYGGYATLVGLTFTPDVFVAGVDLVGISNVQTWLETLPPYWAPLRPMFVHRVGNPDTEAEFLKTRSPVSFVERITAPLLIGQGANDPRVVLAESDQMVEAMRKAGKTVEYIVYPDEGHGLVRPENRLHFYAKAEEFLAEHLGGRFEPAGKISGHSGQIR